MRMLLAGAAGFIGSHLCDSLLEAGHQLVGIDNFLTGSRDNISHLDSEPRFSFLRHDVTQPLSVPGPLDWVLNLASPASPADYMLHPIETLQAGSLGAQRVLELCAEKGGRFLQASTSECYGDPAVHPQPETYWGHVNPIGPRSVYDESKRYAEALVMAYHRHRKMDVRIVRIFNTYGPRMKLNDGRVVPNLVGQALSGRKLTVFGDGSQTRSFCYISDLVDGIVRSMNAGDHLPINLGNPEEISILEFARRIQELTSASAGIEFQPLPPDDPKRRCPDISRARRLLGWQPQVNLDDGLRTTIEYFRKKMEALSH
jgi:dTDP-glucose 4,6-dehydratase